MNHILKLKHYLYPYWKQSILALTLLTAVVFMDLAIPRLIQRIIDQGINQGSTEVVIQTTLIMLGLSVLSAIFAIGNNILSVQAGGQLGADHAHPVDSRRWCWRHTAAAHQEGYPQGESRQDRCSSLQLLHLTFPTLIRFKWYFSRSLRGKGSLGILALGT